MRVGATALAIALSACGGGSGAELPPAPSSTAPPSATLPFWARSQSWGGVVVPVSDLLDGQPTQPTGSALVSLMQQKGVTIVRLLPDDALTADLKTAFDRLNAAGISVIFQLGMGTSTFPSASAFIAQDEATLQAVASAYDGSYPANLVAIDVINEPLVDSSTLPELQQLTGAIRSYAGLPVTIGGWQEPAPGGGPEVYNQPDVVPELAPLVDYLSVHLYPEGRVRDRTSTDPATYFAAAQQYLQQIIAAAPGKAVFVEEYGAINGVGSSKRPGQGSGPHQQAVIDATLQAMQTVRAGAAGLGGVVGGSVWQMEGQAGKTGCNAYSLICSAPAYTSPAIGDWKAYGF